MDDEKRRELWDLATKKNGWTADSIGAQIGESGKALDAIVRRGHKRSKIAPALDSWLIENAHKLANYAMRELKIPNPFVAIGLHMEATGKDLQSPFLESQEKIDRFIEFARQLNQRLKSDITAMEKWIERGD